MATLSQLPPELVLQICDHMFSPTRSANIILPHPETNGWISGVQTEPPITLRGSWATVLRLSQISWRFRRILITRHIHSSICVESNHVPSKRTGIVKSLVSFLQFLDARKASTMQFTTLYMDAYLHNTHACMRQLDAVDLNLISNQAVEVSIPFNEELCNMRRYRTDFANGHQASPEVCFCNTCWSDFRDFGRETDRAVNTVHHRRIGTLASIALRKLKGLENLRIRIHEGVFSSLDEQTKSALPTLPKVKNLAFQSRWGARPTARDARVIAKIAPAASTLHLHSDISLDQSMFNHVAHITLTDFCDGVVEGLLASCQPLKTFKYVPRLRKYDGLGDVGFTLTSQTIIDCLSARHEASLRTLCLDRRKIAGSMDNHVIRSLQPFWNLENVWLNAMQIPQDEVIIFTALGEQEDWTSIRADHVNELIRNLPFSVRTLCIAGNIDSIAGGFSWLSESRHNFPNLRAVHMITDDFQSDEGDYAIKVQKKLDDEGFP